MKLFEYQAKQIFEEFHMPVPDRKLVMKEDDLNEAVQEIGLPCVVKAQVLQGGRGKAGLIQLARSGDEVVQNYKYIQEKISGKCNCLVETVVNFDSELYLSITVDALSGMAVIMACADGGVDIEEIASTNPEKIIKESINPDRGLSNYEALNVMYSLGLNSNLAKQGAHILQQLYRVFQHYEAELVEINPLMVTFDGKLIAADGKISLDDSALFRHTQFTKNRDYFQTDLEYEAAMEGLPFIQFDGDIAIMCAGAGLTNTVFDLVHDYGGTVRSYLEFGGPNYHKATKALTMILQTQPKCILIATFGTIARADVMAEGVTTAFREINPKIPIIVAIRGTGEEKAAELLQSVGLENLDSTEVAVEKAVAYVGGVPV